MRLASTLAVVLLAFVSFVWLTRESPGASRVRLEPGQSRPASLRADAAIDARPITRETFDAGDGGELDADYYWTNVGLVRSVWAAPLGHMIDRAMERCGCDTISSLGSEARLEYHIATRVEVSDRRLSLDEDALLECRRELTERLATCSGSRLPRACELERVFGAPPLEFERAIGEDCRWSNGDEGFDGTFLCAVGSHCRSVCTASVPEQREPRDRCENLLDLPFPAP